MSQQNDKSVDEPCDTKTPVNIKDTIACLKQDCKRKSTLPLHSNEDRKNDDDVITHMEKYPKLDVFHTDEKFTHCNKVVFKDTVYEDIILPIGEYDNHDCDANTTNVDELMKQFQSDKAKTFSKRNCHASVEELAKKAHPLQSNATNDGITFEKTDPEVAAEVVPEITVDKSDEKMGNCGQWIENSFSNDQTDFVEQDDFADKSSSDVNCSKSNDVLSANQRTLDGNIFERVSRLFTKTGCDCSVDDKGLEMLPDKKQVKLIDITEDMSPSQIYTEILTADQQLLSDSEEEEFLITSDEATAATAYLMDNRPHQRSNLLDRVVNKLRDGLCDSETPDFKNAILWVLKDVVVNDEHLASSASITLPPQLQAQVVAPTFKRTTEIDLDSSSLSESASTVQSLLQGGTWRQRLATALKTVATPVIQNSAMKSSKDNQPNRAGPLKDMKFSDTEFTRCYKDSKLKMHLPAKLARQMKAPSRPKAPMKALPPELQTNTSIMRSSLNIEFERDRARTKQNYRQEVDPSVRAQHYYVRTASEEDGADLKLVFRKVAQPRSVSNSMVELSDSSDIKEVYKDKDSHQLPPKFHSSTSYTKRMSNCSVRIPIMSTSSIPVPSKLQHTVDNKSLHIETSTAGIGTTLEEVTCAAASTVACSSCVSTTTALTAPSTIPKQGANITELDDNSSPIQSRPLARGKVPRMLRELENTTGYVAEVRSAASLQREQRAVLRAWQMIAEREQEERLMKGEIGAVHTKVLQPQCHKQLYDCQSENKSKSHLKKPSSKTVAARKIRTKYSTPSLCAQQRLKNLRSTSSTAVSLHTNCASTRRVRLLLKRGASDQYGRTALHLSAEMGEPSLVRECLVKGQSVGSLDANRLTPLHLACMQGHIDTVRVLLQAGADVNAAGGSNGRRPIHEATEWGSVPLVKLLLQAGANPTAETYDGHSLQQLSRSVQMSAFLEGLFSGLCSGSQTLPSPGSRAVVAQEDNHSINGEVVSFELLARKFPSIHWVNLL